MTLPLQNLKVLDMSRVLIGPYATMILGDLGADIIKLEAPGGDDSRQFVPFQNGESAYFMSINRNKRSITLNLKTPEGKEVFKKLVQEVDILVENFRPGTMEKLGLGYDVLCELNPALIYGAASGFGHSGPYSKRAAYDVIVQAMGGLMSLTGHDKPTRVGTSMGDLAGALFLVIGILAAVQAKTITGRGQKVDISMLDCQVALLENAIARYATSGKIPEMLGNRHPGIVPFESFDTADGTIVVAAGNENLWQKLCQAIDREDLILDERFDSNPKRFENYEVLRPMIQQKFSAKTTEEWLKILDDYGIPNGPINTVDKVMNDPQVKARDMIVEVEHPVAGKLKMAGIPVKLSETPGQIRTASPILGAHTEELLREFLDMSDEEMAILREKGVL